MIALLNLCAYSVKVLINWLLVMQMARYGLLEMMFRDIKSNYSRHNEKITSIRCDGDKIIVQTGWSKFYYDWEGNQTDFSDKNTFFEKSTMKEVIEGQD